MQTPHKAKRPSRCATCQADIRRGQLIRYIPADAKPGEPRIWLHLECAHV